MANSKSDKVSADKQPKASKARSCGCGRKRPNVKQYPTFKRNNDSIKTQYPKSV